MAKTIGFGKSFFKDSLIRLLLSAELKSKSINLQSNILKFYKNRIKSKFQNFRTVYNVYFIFEILDTFEHSCFMSRLMI